MKQVPLNFLLFHAFLKFFLCWHLFFQNHVWKIWFNSDILVCDFYHRVQNIFFSLGVFLLKFISKYITVLFLTIRGMHFLLPLVRAYYKKAWTINLYYIYLQGSKVAIFYFLLKIRNDFQVCILKWVKVIPIALLLQNLYLPFHFRVSVHLLKLPVQCSKTTVISSVIVNFQILIEMTSVVFFIVCQNIWFTKNCYIFSILCNLFPSSPLYLEFLLGMSIELSKCISKSFVLTIWFFSFNWLKFFCCILLAYFLILKHPRITGITSFGDSVLLKKFLDSIGKYFL